MHELVAYEPTPIQEIFPLTVEQRAHFQAVIYRHESTMSSDKVLVLATLSAMQADGFQLAIDVETDGSTANHAVVVRSASKDEKIQAAESALFLGVTEATRRRLAEMQLSASIGYHEQVATVAGEITRTVTGKPELLTAFSEYYGGLRWSSDQRRLVKTLFRCGIDFDPKFLQENANGGDMSSLAYELDANISYSQRSEWYATPLAEILMQYPELDFRRLNNDDFRQSEAGELLLRACEHLQGDILSRRQESHELVITADGKILAEPSIPLSKHPVIEALIINEISLDRPRPKYFFGPNDLVNIILESDSAPAHQALVALITTRLPFEHRQSFGSTDEFQFKHGKVAEILREYLRTNNSERKELLKNDFLQILDSYSGDGSMAMSARLDYESRKARGMSEGWAQSEAQKFNEIMIDMLTIAFASNDKEIIAKMEEIVYGYLPEEDGMLVVEHDPLYLTREQIGLALLDAVEFVTADSDPKVFAVMGSYIFGDRQLGAQIGELAQTKSRIVAESNRPDVLRAFDDRRRHHNSLGREQSPEYTAAVQEYNLLTTERDEMSLSLRTSQRELYLSQVERLAEVQVQRDLSDGENRFFKGLIKRIKLGDYHMRALSDEYQRLMALAKSGVLNESQQDTIAWQLYESFQFLDDDAARLLVPVILDIYEIALGSPHDIRFPTHNTSHILSAASSIVGRHGQEMFQSASSEELQTLAAYGMKMRDFAERITSHQLLSDGAMVEDGALVMDGTVVSDDPEWYEFALQNLADVARNLQLIDGYYREYLLIEAVKVQPIEYYAWILKQLMPFWQKMQWEAEPNNRPTQDIKRLYRTIADYISNRFVIQDEYSDEFDVVNDGQFGSFLFEMYQQMIENHSISYNGTVWNEGLTFMHQAVAYMPEAVLMQLRDRFAGSNFVKYVEVERARWNKPEESGVV